jgi:DNA-binding GntR family transcriptional regulator
MRRDKDRSKGMEVSIHTLFARTLEHSDSLVESIVESIGRAIIEGNLHPGDDLNTVDLSKQFNTSRTPVREALLLLEKRGLVTISPYRRPYVARMSLAEAREIYQVRAHLHMLVSELIIKQVSDEAIHMLRAYQSDLQAAAKAGDSDTYFWRSLSFRAAEVEICGNSQLQQTLNSFGLRILQLRYRSLTPTGRLAQSYHDHARLIQAYEERDAPLAMALTRSLILGALAAIEYSNWPNELTEKDLGQPEHKK